MFILFICIVSKVNTSCLIILKKKIQEKIVMYLFYMICIGSTKMRSGPLYFLVKKYMYMKEKLLSIL